jgi:EAL domain-containing protein (putative c-di-GMP-specific phosphodiesterase class I)/PAS domain-containing protein
MTTHGDEIGDGSAGWPASLPPVRGVDPRSDPRLVGPRRYGIEPLRIWWSSVLDPAQLSTSGRWTRRPAIMLASLYLALGVVWILVTTWLASDLSMSNVELLKGVGFVAVTSMLLGALLIHYGYRARRAANRFRELIESTGDLTFRYRIWPTVGIEYISPHIERWTGVPADEFRDQADLFLRHVHPDDRLKFTDMLTHFRDGDSIIIRWIVADGRVLHTSFSMRAVADARRRVVAIDGLVRDVTESRRDRIESEIGSAMMGRLANGEPMRAVVHEACDQIVELMGVEIAAVSVPVSDGSIEVIVAAGQVAALEAVRMRWDQGPLSDGPTGRVIRDGDPVVMTPTDAGFSAWRQHARETGVTACLALPIARDGKVSAVLTLWSRFGNPFDEPNVERFDRIARRLSFALDELPAPPTRGSAHGASSHGPSVDVRRALDDGRFEPWWQPQVDAAGRIVALEMLMRMRDPDGNVLAPNVVIPLAEEQGLMAAIGRATRTRAIEQAAQWLDLGLDRVCVNISVGELVAPGFIGEMERLLRGNVRPAQVEIELVETAPLDSAALRVLRHLVDMGFRVAVDDYGSGWASLSQLSRLPASVIKIDRVFIRDVAVSDRARTLVRSTIELGRSLDLVTVAEGVETADQARLVVELGCDLLQGFLFSAPAPAEHIDALLTSSDRPFWPIIASSLGGLTAV